MTARAGEIPSFIKALTPRGLRLSMLRNNTKHGVTFQYFDIQFVEGKWIAWFYLPARELLKESKNG